MAVSPSILAEAIRVDVGFPSPVSFELQSFCTGLLDELTQSGSATFGGIPGPHPISGMSGTSLATRISNILGIAVFPDFVDYCNALVDHIQDNAFVTYTSPTPPSPIIYTSGGSISGMDGADMADAIAAARGFPNVTNQLLKKCEAIVDHIETFAAVEFGVIS
jgi:hypothetical protein